MSGDVERGLVTARRSLADFDAAGDSVGMGGTLSALAAIELMTGETRAARELYAQAARKLAPWRRAAGWLRLMVAELSLELDDARRAAHELDAVDAIFGRSGGALAGRRMAALRERCPR